MLTHVHDKQLLHPKEAAFELDCHVATIRRAIRRGELEALRLGERGRLRIHRHALEAFLRPAAPPAPTDEKERAWTNP